jgi:hypothetical protein
MHFFACPPVGVASNFPLPWAQMKCHKLLTLLSMIAILRASFCDKILIIIPFLTPANQILAMSPKNADYSVTVEFSIIAKHQLQF